MTVILQEAAKERTLSWDARRCSPRARCASTRPRGGCCRFENSRLGLATSFRQVAPRPKRWTCAEGIREMPSFTAESRWGDQTQQGGGEDPESYSHPNRGRPGSQWEWAGEKTGAARCQRTTVSGLTTTSTSAQRDQSRERTTQKAGSLARRRGRPEVGRKLASCWRRARFSTTRSAWVRRAERSAPRRLRNTETIV